MRLPRLLVALGCMALSPAFVAAPPVAAADVTFEAPSSTTVLGEPIVFRSGLSASEVPTRVELVSTIPGAAALSITLAELSEDGDGSYVATVEQEGHITPNTTSRYHFRAVMADGSVVEGPEATATVVDERFEWRTLEGPIVRLHWYDGDEAFAQRALDIGEQAIADASELLGVTETEPVDFFIYASETDLRAALGPGTRENVGGQANAATRTLFGLIGPNEISSDWVDTLVTHELTHLVFGTAVRNPYHEPPRWLNEGLAVFLSEGHSAGDRSAVEAAANAGTLIPLDALGGLFPTTRDRFGLAYAESVSAVTYFIDTYGQDDLVALIRSYADGVTDDEAFTAATGSDLGAFDEAWVAWLGADVPEPFGPKPAPPGPLPPDWAAASPAAGQSPVPERSPGVGTSPDGRTTTPTTTAGAVETPDPVASAEPPEVEAAAGIDPVPVAVALAAVVGIVLVASSIALRRPR